MAHDYGTANVDQGTQPGWYNYLWVKMGSKIISLNTVFATLAYRNLCFCSTCSF